MTDGFQKTLAMKWEHFKPTYLISGHFFWIVTQRGKAEVEI